MILTPENEQKIIDAVMAEPDKSLVLPDWAYGKSGRCIVVVDQIPIDLHRHLFVKLIRPLGYHERLTNMGDDGNVNPFMFHVKHGNRSSATHCHKGHAYAGNEAPPNSRGYRCLTCLRDSIQRAGTSNAAKTHCPHNHEYTAENTYIGKDGKRRCLTCKRQRNREDMRRRRQLSRKETS